jgi:crotonobetainyl-CoA:carnitine CoA-transferase CaiB-like acyl-CoA transferase
MHTHRFTQMLQQSTKRKPKPHGWKGALDRGLVMAPITRIDEVVSSPQLAARQYWQELQHPELGKSFRYPGPFVKFGETPITYRRRPPLIGEHNREVYIDELGMTEKELAELQSKGVI